MDNNLGNGYQNNDNEEKRKSIFDIFKRKE